MSDKGTTVLIERNKNRDEECQTFRKSLPKEVKEGFISVPEDWSDPNSIKIDVFYYIYRPEIVSPNEPPILFINGGPGSSSHSSFKKRQPRLPTLMSPMVFFDQRGTGCSSRYPTNSMQIGQRLALYSATNIVRDAEVLRKSLFGTNVKWRLFGHSYGSIVIQKYFEIAIEGVAKAHAVTGWLDFISDSAATEKSQQQWPPDLSGKLSGYFARYPHDDALLIRLRSLISSDLCFTDSRMSVCGPDVLDPIIRWIDSEEKWSKVHKTLSSFIDRQEALKIDALREFVTEWTWNWVDLANWAIIVSDFENNAEQEFLNNRSRCFVNRLDNGSPLDECRIIRQTYRQFYDKLKEVKNQSPKWSRILSSISIHPEVKLILYAGKDDDIARHKFAERMSSLGTSNVKLKMLNGNHSTVLDNEELWQDLSM